MNMGGRHQACLISVCSKETMNIFLRDICGGTVSAELWDACGGREYFLTHSGYNADYDMFRTETGMIDIKESVEQAVKVDQERYLFSNDIHYIPVALKFNKQIIVGHYPTIFIPGHEKYSIFFGKKYFDIDTGNERRDEGGRLGCLCLDDGEEYYV